MPAHSFVSRHFGGPQKMVVFVVLKLGWCDNRSEGLAETIIIVSFLRPTNSLIKVFKQGISPF